MTGKIKKIHRNHVDRAIILVIEGKDKDYFLHLRQGQDVRFRVSRVDPTRAENLSYVKDLDLRKVGLV